MISWRACSRRHGVTWPRWRLLRWSGACCTGSRPASAMRSTSAAATGLALDCSARWRASRAHCRHWWAQLAGDRSLVPYADHPGPPIRAPGPGRRRLAGLRHRVCRGWRSGCGARQCHPVAPSVLSQLFALEHQMTRAGRLAGALDGMGCPVPFVRQVATWPTMGGLPAAGHWRRAHHAQPGAGRHRASPARRDLLRWPGLPALGLAAMARRCGRCRLVAAQGSGWLDAPWSLVDTRQGAAVRCRSMRKATSACPGICTLTASSAFRRSMCSTAAAPACSIRPGYWGSSAFGLNDVIATPFSPNAAGVQVHASCWSGWWRGRALPAPQRPGCRSRVPCRGSDCCGGWLQASPPVAMVCCAVAHCPSICHWPPWAGLSCFACCTVCCWSGLSLDRLGAAALAVLAAGMAWGIWNMRAAASTATASTHLPATCRHRLPPHWRLQPPSSAIKAETRARSACCLPTSATSRPTARPARPRKQPPCCTPFLHCHPCGPGAWRHDREAFQGDAILAVWNGTPGRVPARHGRPFAPRAARRDRVALAMDGVLPTRHRLAWNPRAGHRRRKRTRHGRLFSGQPPHHMVMGRTVTIASRLVGMTADRIPSWWARGWLPPTSEARGSNPWEPFCSTACACRTSCLSAVQWAATGLTGCPAPSWPWRRVLPAGAVPVSCWPPAPAWAHMMRSTPPTRRRLARPPRWPTGRAPAPVRKARPGLPALANWCAEPRAVSAGAGAPGARHHARSRLRAHNWAMHWRWLAAVTSARPSTCRRPCYGARPARTAAHPCGGKSGRWLALQQLCAWPPGAPWPGPAYRLRQQPAGSAGLGQLSWPCRGQTLTLPLDSAYQRRPGSYVRAMPGRAHRTAPTVWSWRGDQPAQRGNPLAGRARLLQSGQGRARNLVARCPMRRCPAHACMPTWTWAPDRSRWYPLR